MKYLLFHNADKSQDDIWKYTLNTWGESQAIKYIKGLHQHFDKLANNKLVWHKLPKNKINPKRIKSNIYFSKCKYYYIYFKELL